jgi:RNA polymerase sigma-70 factor (ECF subfamily)
MHNDETLLLEAAKQDLENFTALYDLYVDRMWKYFLIRTSDGVLAEDLTSQTFLKAIEAFDRYKISSIPFGAWLFRIARNTLIDHTRKAKWECLLESVPDAGSDSKISDASHKVILVERIRKILSTFDPQLQEIILLKLVSDLKFSTIADQLDLSENTVKTKYFRGLKKLKTEAGELMGLILLLEFL